MTKEGVFYKIGATEGFTPTDVYMARFNEKGELYVCTNDGIFILKNPDTLVQKLTSTEATLPSHSLIVAPNPASGYTELQGAKAHALNNTRWGAIAQDAVRYSRRSTHWIRGNNPRHLLPRRRV